jgi:RHS repeat-associated protein
VAGSTTTQFLYEGSRLSAEFDGSGNVLRRYVHGTGTDEPIVWYEGSGTTDRRWLHQDAQGSVVGYSGSTGGMTTIYAYGPYGEPQSSSWGGSRFAYTGQIQLPEAKLYYYKARVYDPMTGRFLQTDPIGYKDDIDWYAYVGADPLNKSDPTGTDMAVILAGPSKNNPFGHVAIAFSGKGVYSYGTQEKLGSSATNYTNSRLADGRTMTIVTLHTTPAQDAAAMKAFVAFTHSGKYAVIGHSCVDAVKEALKAAGIVAPASHDFVDPVAGPAPYRAEDTPLPPSAALIAADQKGATIVVLKHQPAPDSLKKFDPPPPPKKEDEK